MSSELEAASQAPAEERADSTAGPHAGQPFTLDITFSGLVLLVPEKGTGKLLVLLPDANGHGGHGGNGGHAGRHSIPKHFAVLGAHERYKPTGGAAKGRFHELEMKKGTLVLGLDFGGEQGTTNFIDFDKFNVANLGEVADGKKPLRTKSWVQLEIGAGEVCDDCAHDDGATWDFGGKKQKMATRLTWRIAGLKNKLDDGQPGIVFRLMKGNATEDFVVRATEEPSCAGAATGALRAAVYLYNTPADELPSSNGHPERPDPIDPRNRHFGVYYGLFDPPLDEDLPIHVPEDRLFDEPDEVVERWEKAFDPGALERLQPHERALEQRFLAFHGRLYTCAIAQFDETAAAAAADRSAGKPDITTQRREEA